MNKPRVFADFHNADVQGRLRLNCIGTIDFSVVENSGVQNPPDLLNFCILYSFYQNTCDRSCTTRW